MKRFSPKSVYIAIIVLIMINLSCYINSTGTSTENPVNPYNEEYITTSFRDDFNGTTIDETIWQIATWAEQGGQTSKERCYIKDGFLNLIFKYNPTASPYKYLCSAIQTRKEFLYGKWEARLKTSNVPGVLNSIFTIDWDNTETSASYDDGTKQEIDIEFLTKYQDKVHFAVHARDKVSFQTNPDVKIDFNHSDDFHIWAINITPDYIEWSVDDIVLKKYVYSAGDVRITSPYQLKLNAWSSTDWIEGPPEPNVECVYQIDWIQFTPYNDEKKFLNKNR